MPRGRYSCTYRDYGRSVREREVGLPERFKVLCILGIGEVAEADMLKPRDRELEWERTYVEQYEEREE